MVVIVFGLPGSGKSFFAFRLASLIDAVYINSDQVRKKMLVQKTYTAGEKLLVYDRMADEMKKAMLEGKNVVLDATFYKDSIRTKFIEATENSGGVTFIEMKAGEELIKERLKLPRDDSDADYKVYKIIEAEWEPLADQHLILHSTNSNIDELLEKAMKYLHLK